MQMPLSSGTYTIYIYPIQNPGKPLCRPARRASSRSQPKPGHRYQERAGVSFGVYAYIYMGGCSLQIYVSVSTYLHIHRRTPAHIYKHPRTRVYIYWVSFCGCLNTLNSSDGASARSSFDRSAHVLGVDQKNKTTLRLAAQSKKIQFHAPHVGTQKNKALGSKPIKPFQSEIPTHRHF